MSVKIPETHFPFCFLFAPNLSTYRFIPLEAHVIFYFPQLAFASKSLHSSLHLGDCVHNIIITYTLARPHFLRSNLSWCSFTFCFPPHGFSFSSRRTECFKSLLTRKMALLCNHQLLCLLILLLLFFPFSNILFLRVGWAVHTDMRGYVLYMYMGCYYYFSCHLFYFYFNRTRENGKEGFLACVCLLLLV